MDAVAAMTVALAPKKALTSMALPHQKHRVMQTPQATAIPAKGRRAASPANAVRVTAMAATAASAVAVVSAAYAATRLPSPAQPKAKKPRKSSTWCARLTSPSPLPLQHR